MYFLSQFQYILENKVGMGPNDFFLDECCYLPISEESQDKDSGALDSLCNISLFPI
jgi:hypothetical protein